MLSSPFVNTKMADIYVRSVSAADWAKGPFTRGVNMANWAGNPFTRGKKKAQGEGGPLGGPLRNSELQHLPVRPWYTGKENGAQNRDTNLPLNNSGKITLCYILPCTIKSVEKNDIHTGFPIEPSSNVFISAFG